MPNLLAAHKRRSLSLAFERTCKAVNIVVKPHPDFVIPLSRLKRPSRPSWTRSMNRSTSRSLSRRSNASRDLSAGSFGVSDSGGLSWRENSSRSFLSEDDAKVRHVPMDKDASSAHKSDHQQAEQRASKRRRRMTSAGLNATTSSSGGRFARLQRTKGLIQSDGRVRPKSEPALPTSPPSSQDESSPASSTEDLSYVNLSMISPSLLSKAKSLTPIMEHADSLGGIVNHSTSSFVLPTLEETEPIQFIDEHSGALFARVDNAKGGQVSAEEFERNSLKSTTSLSLHIGSPPPALVDDIHAHIASLPSFVLTIPTPELPSSPIFVPQSQFNSESFLEAADASTPVLTVSGPHRPVSCPVPALPRCDHPNPDGEPGELCRSCETQMLACRVWYQERDCGRRQSLREPLIRPGESTASNRALMEMLGLPAGPALGLGINMTSDDSDEAHLQERAEPELDGAAALAHNDADSGDQARSAQAHVRRRLSLSAKDIMRRVTGMLRRGPSQRTGARGSDSRNKLTKSVRPTSFLALEDSVPVLGSRKLWRRSQ